jgi:hypothetical protein
MTTSLRFGQYRGWPITAVPPGYLKWILRNRLLPAHMRRAICAELGRLKVDKTRPGYPATLHEQRRRGLARPSRRGGRPLSGK